MPAAASARFLDPLVLARIDDLELLARAVVEGFIAGLHRAPHVGHSVDFAEHRPYMPGDDVRRIDWRLFARTDRHYVKEFEADSNANFLVLLDRSRSMQFSSGGVSKLDYGRYLAACLTHFAHKQRDRVGLVTFDADVVDYVPPSARHREAVLHALDRLEPGGRGELAGPLLRAAETSRRRGIFVLISDLYEDPDAALRAVRQLAHGGGDVIVFQLLDPAELHFPDDAAASYEDLETGERMPVVPDYVREQYRALVADHVSALERRFGESRIDSLMIETSTPLDQALFHYLVRRQRFDRVR
jgi:uncharacterized protein (DUF58 family)